MEKKMKNYVAEIFRNNMPLTDKTAIVDNDGRRNTSWKEIYMKSCAVAAYASKQGLKGLVPVCMPRCAETIEVMLGLGLAGLGLAPLSDHTPEERIKMIEEQAENTVWTKKQYEEAMKLLGTEFEPVDFEDDAAAYVVFTSGSTGTPKGVVLSNDVVMKAYIRMGLSEGLNLREGDLVLQNASFSFVAILIDIYAPLYYGCPTHILPERARTDVELMTRYINEHGITSMFITPKPLMRLGDAPSLRVVCVGGERVSGIGPKGYKLLNVWGMSETAALALGYTIDEPMEKTPIGKSGGDFNIYIVDDGKLADEGELCLSGAIASGYLKRPDLNEEYFEPNPYSSEEGHRVLMHTGDIVRRLEDGNILYLNRKDYMIKINGQRVEPGEAEAAIEKIEGIKGVAVKGFTEEDGHSYLCAYYVCDEDLEGEEIRDELEKRLPSYMVPAFYERLESLPLNANGKIDRNALAAPDTSRLHSEYVAPENDMEALICQAFELALKAGRVGAEDDFFWLGGDSIRAMSIVSYAGIEGLTTADILKGRTPRRIAELAQKNAKTEYVLTDKKEKAPLTDSQMGIYLECQEAPETIKYNIPYSVTLDSVDGMSNEKIKECIDKVIALHPALYSRIVTEGEDVVMKRHDMPSGGICTIGEISWESFVRPFELDKEPPCRINISMEDGRIKLMIDTHHIVSDGASTAILVNQILRALKGEGIEGEKVDAFSVYERLKKDSYNPEHFGALLGGVETDSNLLPDKKSEETDAPAERVILKIDDIDFNRLHRNGITKSSFFMGVFGYTLAKMTGLSESLFAAAENGRKNQETDNTVLMMVRTLPVYMKIDEKKSAFTQLLELQNQFYGSIENDNVSFGELCSEYGITSDVMFVYQSDTISGAGEADVEIRATGKAISNFNAAVFKKGDTHEVILEYRSDLYDRETIERFGYIYMNACRAFAADELLSRISLICDEDRAFLDRLNMTETACNHNETVADIFLRMAEIHRDKTAIICEDRSYTYGEALRISRNIAGYIHSLGIGREQVVSVLIHRNEYMYMASMGIMMAGAAYQPLDPSYPEERLSFMTEDASASLLIADKELMHMLPDFKGKVLLTEDIPGLEETVDLDCLPMPEDLCMLLYTSGTTGKPKGCRINHKNLRAITNAHAVVTGMDENTIQGAYASYGFDAHMADLYPALALGGTLVIIPDGFRLDLDAVKDYLEGNHVSHVIFTTQICVQFIRQFKRLEYLKCIVTGGEKLVTSSIPENYRIINGYGPTECVVYSTCFEVDNVYEDIPIGKAIPDNKLYVADSEGRRLPPGIPGELIIAGPQVTEGYLNRPEKTAEVFVPNTFEEKIAPGYENCYRTGDIVRYIGDGNLVFIGRRDLQVKIRGFRIELSEVERVIKEFAGVKDAVLVAKDAPVGGKCLHAYITGDEKIDIAAMNEYIRSVKPPYMVPAAAMQIDSLPLTVNGKVDKRKLPEIKMHFEDVVKPQNEIQQRIFDRAVSAIGTEDFGINTDLFMAGLSSIGSIRLCSLLAEEFGIHVQMRSLKKYPTVARLEELVLKETGAEAEVNAAEDKSYPISKTMEGIFTECIGKPDSTFYNIPYLVKLASDVDEVKLKAALTAAVEAHPYMKAELFTDKEGRIRQHRRPDDIFTADMIKTGDSLEGLVKPFNITEGRLFEISIIHADGTYLYLNFHHVIADGTSINIFLSDVERAYNGEKLEAEAFTGFDVAEEEVKARTDEELAEAKEYFGDMLEGLDREFLLIPDRYPQDEISDGKLVVKLKTARLSDIEKYCSRNRVSMNAFFVSAFGFVLSRYAGTDYSVFDTIYNGRNDSRTKDTFAMLVKTLPAVCHTDRESSIELAREMSSQLIDSMANDIYSYGEIARSFGVNSDVMFIFQGGSFRRETFLGGKVQEIELELSESKAPMALQVMFEGEDIVCEMEYDPLRFTEKLMGSFLSAYDMACAAFAAEKKLSEISLLSEEEEKKMEIFNATEFEYDRSRTVTDLFLEQVEKQPEKLCVAYRGRRVTYKEAEILTGKVAAFLMDNGIGGEDVVPILINRDENMVIAGHGVVRAGAAYLGLDPTYPADRLEFMIKDCGARYLIADRSLMHLIPGYEGPVLYVDEIEGLSELSPERKADTTPENNAIVIYSSGTTGLPKGSVLQHKAIVCFFHNYTKDMEMDTDSNVATYASFGFDGGAQDVFCIPMLGASLFVIPDDIRLDMRSLEQFYIRNSITNGFMTTQVGTMFVANTKCHTLRNFVVGGEKLIPVTAPEWVRFQNGYGPSETMCYVNSYVVRDTGALQPIGKVSGNTKEYIIDKFGNRLPFGACGELCISGGQMGRGYLNRPEKTAEVFVDNPFSEAEGYERMYRTGDVVRLLPDGNYDFVGRRDGQVKIRGFRVELSEIEGRIRQFEGVEKVVVSAFDNPAGGKALAAYIVAEGEIDIERLKIFIAEEKPDYMIPAAIMQMEEIPLTSNGKVDFRKLPKPDLRSSRKGIEPADETEEKICSIFGEVLGLDKVYADDDFFAIGGSSISAIQVTVKCEQAGMAVVYKNLFANPTAQKLTAFICGKSGEDIAASDLEKGDGHNYEALKYNVVENLKGIRNNGVGDVLLTGATGFLGSHVFRELLDSTGSNVICIVRSKDGISAEDRLEMMMVYYFEEWYSGELARRVTVIDGDIEDEDVIEKLKDIHFDTIINSAANVKHFAAGDELLGANFTGVENLISLAEMKGARLIQISSLSVCGESVNGSIPAGYKFKETDLNIGQSLENKYIYTKYLAEQAVIDAVSNRRIKGKIIRLGNLMARMDDSEFQVNAGTNGFLRMYIGFSKLGCFPIGMMDAPVEFSPIDAVARAVVILSGTPDEFTVFHAKNSNTIQYGYFLNALCRKAGPVEIVEDDVFEERLEKALNNGQDVEKLGGLLAYRNGLDGSLTDAVKFYGDDNSNRDVRVKLGSETTFTTKALYRLGFAWPLISGEYLDRMVEALVELNFFIED